ncbi:MAG: hypothetical protein CL947_01745 [Epsilonproteobacteria bacterium]|nr:hypothetical protein [Campylobacterota bacterium]
MKKVSTLQLFVFFVTFATGVCLGQEEKSRDIEQSSKEVFVKTTSFEGSNSVWDAVVNVCKRLEKDYHSLDSRTRLDMIRDSVAYFVFVGTLYTFIKTLPTKDHVSVHRFGLESPSFLSSDYWSSKK